VELEAGTYSLTVTAKKGDVEVAVGTAADVAVTSGGNTTATVILEPKTWAGAAADTFSYNITIPTGASGSLTIATATGGAVADGTKTLAAGVNADTVSLPPGEYRLAVSLEKDGKTAGFNNEAVYVYPALTSAFAREVTDDHFSGTGQGPTLGQAGVNVAYGLTPKQVVLYVPDGPYDYATPIALVKGGEPYGVSVPQSVGWTGAEWSVDGTPIAAQGIGITLDPDDYDVGIHYLTITATAVTNSKTYSELVEFAVVAAGTTLPQTVGPVNAEGLAAALESLTTDGSPEAPHTVKLSGFNVSSNTWGTTVKNALNGNTKYIILDLGACTSGGTIASDGGNEFNVINGNYNVVGVILPNDVTEIGSGAFFPWPGLRYVTMPSGVLTISDNAFNGATNLKSITLPNSLETIDMAAFQQSGLESITIPASVTSIGMLAFDSCDSLTSVTFLGNATVLSTLSIYPSFDGDLDTVYKAVATKAGIYTKISGMGSTSAWSKQQ
jgi:hypothetical protein